ncbi:methyltransferase domain-containing protein [bacterium]|nr:methyltransferase domain-containing protein [bacterium]
MRAISNSWNAEDYADNSSAQKKWASELMAKLHLEGHEAVLDIGCGDGRIAYEIAGRLPDGSVTGIDLSESMIALASRNFQRDNLQFIVMDATDIRLESRVDVAFSNAVLHWVRNHEQMLNGLKKVLSPDARILFQMGGAGNAADVASCVETVIARNAWTGYFTGFEFPYYFYDVKDYKKWLPACGYRPVRIERIPKDMVHGDREGLSGWLRTTWFPYTDRIPGEKRETFLDEVLETYLSSYPADPEGRTHVRMMRLEVEAVID